MHLRLHARQPFSCRREWLVPFHPSFIWRRTEWALKGRMWFETRDIFLPSLVAMRKVIAQLFTRYLCFGSEESY